MITPDDALPPDAGNKERILAVMQKGVWYRPSEIKAITGIARVDTYLKRLSQDGMVRKQNAGLNDLKMFKYRIVNQ